MSKTLWLIAEDDSTAAVIQAIFKGKGITAQVRLLGSAVGISMLAQEIHNLIAEAKHQRKAGDCIVVCQEPIKTIRS